MQPDIHRFLLRHGGRLALGADIETDHNGVGSGGEQHVGFADAAHTAAHDLDSDLLRAQPLQLLAQGFHRAVHVGLQNQRQFLDRAGFQLLVQVVEGHTGAGSQGHFPHLLLAEGSHLLGLDLVGHHLELIPGFRQRVQAQNFDRRGRGRLLDRAAVIVKHGPNLAKHGADNKGVAAAQGSILHQHGGHRPPPPVEPGFQHHPPSRESGCGAQLLQVGNQQNHFQELLQVGLLFGRHFYHYRLATPVFRHQAAVGELLLHALGQGVGLVNLVDRHQDGNIGGAGVVNGFQGLGHHAVVGRHHQHHYVGHLGAAGAHAGEGGVAGRVNENNPAPIHVYLRGADVLGDAAGFAGERVSFADGIQQRGFSVVHVTHHGDHRRAGNLLAARLLLHYLFCGLLFEANHFGGGIELLRHLDRQAGVERLVDGDQHAAIQQDLDHILGAHLQLLRQLLDSDAFGDGDLDRLPANQRSFPQGGRLALAAHRFRVGAHWMQKPALTFVEPFFQVRPTCRTSACRRFALVNGFAGDGRGWTFRWSGGSRPAKRHCSGRRRPGDNVPRYPWGHWLRARRRAAGCSGTERLGGSAGRRQHNCTRGRPGRGGSLFGSSPLSNGTLSSNLFCGGFLNRSALGRGFGLLLAPRGFFLGRLLGAKMGSHLVGDFVFDRTGVGLLFGDANLGQVVEYQPALDFELSPQFVDANLSHFDSRG